MKKQFVEQLADLMRVEHQNLCCLPVPDPKDLVFVIQDQDFIFTSDGKCIRSEFIFLHRNKSRRRIHRLHDLGGQAVLVLVDRNRKEHFGVAQHDDFRRCRILLALFVGRLRRGLRGFLCRRLCRFLRRFCHRLGRLCVRTGRFYVLLRVREEADAHDDAGDKGHKDHPESGLLVIQNTFDALLHADFAKGQRACRDLPSLDAEVQKGLRIAGDLVPVHFLDGLLVAGGFDVTAEKNVGHPAERIEPIDRQEQIAKWLPPVVAPSKVRFFMREHVFQFVSAQRRRHVDDRLHDAQNERSLQFIGRPDVASQPDRRRGLDPKFQISDQGIDQEADDARDPDHDGNERPGLPGDPGRFRGISCFILKNWILDGRGLPVSL